MKYKQASVCFYFLFGIFIIWISKFKKKPIKTTLKFCQTSCNFAQLCIRFTHLDTVYKTDLEGTYNYSSTIYKSLPQGTLFFRITIITIYGSHIDSTPRERFWERSLSFFCLWFCSGLYLKVKCKVSSLCFIKILLRNLAKV